MSLVRRREKSPDARSPPSPSGASQAASNRWAELGWIWEGEPLGVTDIAGEVSVTRPKKVTYREQSHQVQSSEPLPHAIWKGCGLKNLARLSLRGPGRERR